MSFHFNKIGFVPGRRTLSAQISESCSTLSPVLRICIHLTDRVLLSFAERPRWPWSWSKAAWSWTPDSCVGWVVPWPDWLCCLASPKPWPPVSPHTTSCQISPGNGAWYSGERIEFEITDLDHVQIWKTAQRLQVLVVKRRIRLPVAYPRGGRTLNNDLNNLKYFKIKYYIFWFKRT